MNNKQREGGYWDTPHGLLAQVENLCALEHELIFSEISELASRAREAMLTPPAPSDWETELDDAAESAAGMESVTGAAYWVAKKAKDILRRALATRPGVDVECDHVFVGDHTEEGGVMCVKCGVDIYDTPPAPSDWEDELYRLAEKINLSEAFAADDQIEEVIAFVRALTTSTEGEDD